MFDVTNFLVRWLFLSNLIRNVAEIQTLEVNPESHMLYDPYQTKFRSEDEWKDHCLRGIASCQSGSQRLLEIDAKRAELVHQLAASLEDADKTMKRYEAARRRENERVILSSAAQSSGGSGRKNGSGEGRDSGVVDPYLDADTEILKAFGAESLVDLSPEYADGEAALVIENKENESTTSPGGQTSNAVLVQSQTKRDNDNIPPTPQEIEDAQQTIRIVRDYLPQLASVVLKSPAAFEARLLDPISKLRQLVIRRCVDDANWGVDMCWLLEAEVGRAWKTLFEHRQQTGRRLIVMLPADKAAVLAKIGTEKKEAFDLLQDAEQATAYGYTPPSAAEYAFRPHSRQMLAPNGAPATGYHPNLQTEALPQRERRLPSSLSLRRCSHFGDTMHFIDRLTKISLELRQIPTINRHAYLLQKLKEVNRRIRRRMVTRGDVSLDVEDNLKPDDWPTISDISTDLIRYSVHLPLDPKQQSRWPGGGLTAELSNGGAVRVLNIVEDECRILSSRERCPYLVRLEVAETGLNGNDSRLYASGAPGLGATVGEALSMSAFPGGMPGRSGKPTFQIPSELLSSPAVVSQQKSIQDTTTFDSKAATDGKSSQSRGGSLRGGSQNDESVYYSHQPEDVYNTGTYDQVRQNEYERLHQRMYTDFEMAQHPPRELEPANPLLSTREALLDRVFGQPLADKCEEIRQASPYGNVPGWRLASFIIKAGEDIRREAFVMQIISKLSEWFKAEIPEESRPQMRPYTIMCVGGDAGLVECLSDAKSIDEVKKRTDSFVSLRDFFERAYGPPTAYGQQQYSGSRPGFTNHSNNNNQGPGSTVTFEQAQDNFLRSLVGYSLVCYILQIKDRHNANILLDREGNVMHIDFGFVLGDTPKMSKVPIFHESAPFKLSAEFWEVLGGWNSKRGGLGVRFCQMFEQAFACASSHTEEIASLVEATMLTLTQSHRQARSLANGVRARLRMRGPVGSSTQQAFIMELVNRAQTSLGTSTYDWLQKNMNGYQ